MIKKSAGKKKATGLKKRVFRKKVCRMCTDKVKELDYKSPRDFQRYTTERGKIVPRRVMGACAKQQRMIAMPIKKARQMAVLG